MRFARFFFFLLCCCFLMQFFAFFFRFRIVLALMTRSFELSVVLQSLLFYVYIGFFNGSKLPQHCDVVVMLKNSKKKPLFILNAERLVYAIMVLVISSDDYVYYSLQTRDFKRFSFLRIESVSAQRNGGKSFTCHLCLFAESNIFALSPFLLNVLDIFFALT